MKKLWECRRTFTAITAIASLTALGFYTSDVSVAISIASVSAALAASNAFEKKDKK